MDYFAGDLRWISVILFILSNTNKWFNKRDIEVIHIEALLSHCLSFNARI